MTFLRLLFLALLAISLLIVALANMGPVTLQLLPGFLADSVDLPSVTLPVFVVIFIAAGIGLLIGFTWNGCGSISIGPRRHANGPSGSGWSVSWRRPRRRPSERDEILALVEAPR